MGQVDFQAGLYQRAPGHDAVGRTFVYEGELVACGGIDSAQREAMCCFVRTGAVESEEDSAGRVLIDVFDTVPVNAVGARRHVVRIRASDERAQAAFVKRDCLLRCGVLLGGPAGGVQHQ